MLGLVVASFNVAVAGAGSAPDRTGPVSTAGPVAWPDDQAETFTLRRLAAASRASRAATASARPLRPVGQAHAYASRPPQSPRSRTFRPPPRHQSAVPVPGGGAARVGAVTAFALSQVGKPYRWAAAGPGSYDCSGLVMAAYASVGVRLPHRTHALVGHGRPVARGELKLGDLVFPSRGHVGIYIGGGRMVHAPRSGTRVKTSAIYSFWTARRLM